MALERGFDLFLDLENDGNVYNRHMDGTVNGNTKILEELFLEILEPLDE